VVRSFLAETHRVCQLFAFHRTGGICKQIPPKTLQKRRDRDSNPGYPCGYSGFQDRNGNSVSSCGDNDLRKSDQSVAAPIAAPIGRNLATNGNTCHLTGDLSRVVEAWQRLSAEARLMILALVSAAESNTSHSDK